MSEHGKKHSQFSENSEHEELKESTYTALSPKLLKRRKSILLSIILLLVLLIGGIAAYALTKGSLDLRQRAAYVAPGQA